jgi:N-acetylglucosaminyl-diphospho-decaprenol L-rhamnosyltransferase
VQAGYRLVYDGSVQITHLKGLSVAKELEAMSRAIFDANRDVWLKHFVPEPRDAWAARWTIWKYRVAFAAWKTVARWRAKLRGHRKVRPV